MQQLHFVLRRKTERTTCKLMEKKMSNKNQKRIETLDRHHLCHKCEKAKQLPNRKYCAECLEKIQLINIERYDPIKAHEYQARRRELYQEKKKNGICVRCSEKATHGLYCYRHSIQEKRKSKSRAQIRKRERHERGLIPEHRKLNGLCCFCGEALGERQNYTQCCKACAEKFSEISHRGDKALIKQWVNEFWLTRWDGLKNSEKENKK